MISPFLPHEGSVLCEIVNLTATVSRLPPSTERRKDAGTTLDSCLDAGPLLAFQHQTTLHRCIYVRPVFPLFSVTGTATYAPLRKHPDNNTSDDADLCLMQRKVATMGLLFKNVTVVPFPILYAFEPLGSV